MAAPFDSYPFATQQGVQIRPDIIKPVHLVVFPFTLSAMTAIDTTSLAIDKVYQLYATQDCMLGFGAAPVAAVASGNNLFLPKNTYITISPNMSLIGLSALGVTVAGTLYIQEIVTWAGLANPASTRRV